MARYQLTLVVDVEVADEDEALHVGEQLEEFLGLHYRTDTLGTLTHCTELDQEVTPLIPNEESLEVA